MTASSSEGQGPPSSTIASPTIQRLTKRPQFLAAAKGTHLRARGGRPGLDRADQASTVGAGFTATRRIGGAVVRNRAKRRLREAARLMLPLYSRPGCDYVFVARAGTATRPWRRLLDDIKSALISLAANQVPAANSPADASR